jgi:hypothetical protein
MARTSAVVRLALFGESDHGKSHYGAQLLNRIESDRCEFKLRESPSDLSAFDEVRAQLNAGLLAAHTPSGIYRESLWPIRATHGREVDLSWPDYAGEQIRKLIESRKMNEDWVQRTQEADGWILMIRPTLAKPDDDVFSRPLGDLRDTTGDAEKSPRRSVQARLVELLQLLLYARGTNGRRSAPPLAVLLSCWDELKFPANTKPGDVLDSKLPLLASFLRARWRSQALIFGVSALGTELSTKEANEAFIDRGPAQFGWVIGPDGQQDPDLTLPIARLSQLAGL